MRLTTTDRELEIIRLRKQIFELEIQISRRNKRIKKMLKSTEYKLALKDKKIQELEAANWSLTVALDSERYGQG